MDSKNLMSRIEALLFVAGDDGMTARQLAQYLEVEVIDIEAGLSELETKYNETEEHGITIKQLAGTYQLTTKQSVADTIKKLVENPTSQVLTSASLEVLAIIAYKQPVSRGEADLIRGKSTSWMVFEQLEERGWIKVVAYGGDSSRRTALYGTTLEFLEYFGLNDIQDLP